MALWVYCNKKYLQKRITIINTFVVVVVVHPSQPKIKTFEQIQFAKMLFTCRAFYIYINWLLYLNNVLKCNYSEVVPGILD